MHIVLLVFLIQFACNVAHTDVSAADLDISFRYVSTQLSALDTAYIGMGVHIDTEKPAFTTHVTDGNVEVHIPVRVTAPKGTNFARPVDSAEPGVVWVDAGTLRITCIVLYVGAPSDGTPQALAVSYFPSFAEPEWDWDCDEVGCA